MGAYGTGISSKKKKKSMAVFLDQFLIEKARATRRAQEGEEDVMSVYGFCCFTPLIKKKTKKFGSFFCCWSRIIAQNRAAAREITRQSNIYELPLPRRMILVVLVLTMPPVKTCSITPSRSRKIKKRNTRTKNKCRNHKNEKWYCCSIMSFCVWQH